MTEAAESAGIKAVKVWYEKFDAKDLDGVVEPFADNAILLIGAGESESHVPYGGRFVGKAQIRHHYASRFSNTMQIIRPLCGLKPFMHQIGRWVVVKGNIRDNQGTTRLVYQGDYLHVWSINPDGKFASMSMYFDAPSIAAT